MNSRLVIITGANGAVGNCFVKHFLQEKRTNCVAVSRSPMVTDALHCQVDLLDSKATEQAINQLEFAGFSDVMVIHGVGKFKYENECTQESRNYTHSKVDQEIFQSNYHTFVNVVKPLVEKLNREHQQGYQTRLALCGFGSITDKYKIPFWRSYTYAKDTLRDYIKDLATSQEWRGMIRGRFINVSTTDTGNENKLRPKATTQEKKYWLKPEKIVKQSIGFLERLTPLWQELDVYEPLPGFDPQAYYRNYNTIRNKWERQMGVG